MLPCFLMCIFRFINARRRIVQPMIDQSNRAGKSKPHDDQVLDGQNLAYKPISKRSPTTTTTARQRSHPKQNREMIPCQKKPYHGTNSTKTLVKAARVVFRRSPLSSRTKGKIV